MQTFSKTSFWAKYISQAIIFVLCCALLAAVTLMQDGWFSYLIFYHILYALPVFFIILNPLIALLRQLVENKLLPYINFASKTVYMAALLLLPVIFMPYKDFALWLVLAAVFVPVSVVLLEQFIENRFFSKGKSETQKAVFRDFVPPCEPRTKLPAGGKILFGLAFICLLGALFSPFVQKSCYSLSREGKGDYIVNYLYAKNSCAAINEGQIKGFIIEQKNFLWEDWYEVVLETTNSSKIPLLKTYDKDMADRIIKDFYDTNYYTYISIDDAVCRLPKLLLLCAAIAFALGGVVFTKLFPN